MSFSEKTIEVIKNFASINQGIVFKPGNLLRTCSNAKNIFASAEIPDNIPVEFAIYDLNAFLSTLSLFDEPSVEFKEKHLLISSGKSKIKYYFASAAVVVSPPEKVPQFTDAKLKFTLTDSAWRQIQKASSVLKLVKLNISEGKLQATGDKDNPNTFDVDVETEGSFNGSAFVKIENIKLIPGDYDVEVYDRAIQFTCTEDKSLVYLVAVEND